MLAHECKASSDRPKTLFNLPVSIIFAMIIFSQMESWYQHGYCWVVLIVFCAQLYLCIKMHSLNCNVSLLWRTASAHVNTMYLVLCYNFSGLSSAIISYHRTELWESLLMKQVVSRFLPGGWSLFLTITHYYWQTHLSTFSYCYWKVWPSCRNTFNIEFPKSKFLI